MNDLIVVTNWEEVEKDDFYLTKEWEKEVGKENIKRAKALQKEGNLFIAYIVNAKDYCIYGQMDSDQIFIDDKQNEILRCETQVIGDDLEDKWEYKEF